MTTTAPALTLAQMVQRRAELASDLAQAQTTLAEAQDGLLLGTAEPRAVIEAQAALSALDGALAAADERVDQLTKEAEARKAAAYRQRLLDKLVQGADQATGHLQEFTSELTQALGQLAPKLEDAFAELYQLQELREGWVQALADLDRALPTPGTALALVSAQTDVKAIRLKPLPHSWHHGLVSSYDSPLTHSQPPELGQLIDLYYLLVKAGKLPQLKLEGAVQ